MDDWTSAERLLSSGGALAVLLVLAWRLPCIVKVMLTFGLEVQRLNYELLRSCCTRARSIELHQAGDQDQPPNVLP